MRLRIFKKFFFTTSIIILLSLMVMMMIMTFVFNSYMAKTNYDSLDKTCEAVSNFTENAFKTGNIDAKDEYRQSLYYIMNNLGYVTGFDVFIVDSNGKIQGCSCDEWVNTGKCEHSNNVISADLIERASKKGNCNELNTLGIYPSPHYISANALEIDRKHSGIVISAAPMSVIHSFIQTMVRMYFLSAVVPIIIMFVAIYIMTYRLTRPVKQMSLAAKAMAKGDFSKRIPVTSDDEIGELAVSFNQMTNSLVQLEGMRRSFVANVSHELKTPMTTIAGFIDGIIDGTIEPEKHEYYLKIVSNEVKRLSRLVISMLEIAKLESGEFTFKKENFDFRELILEVVVSQEQRIENKNINIVGLDTLSDVSIYADRDLIHQVIYNLVDNAVKFSDEGGDIKFTLNTDSKRMIFNITNTGKGIPADSLPYIFDRFYKVDKSRSANKNSTGLGLHIAKTIIKSHGGTITVSSHENEFTMFEIILPLIK